MNTVSAEKTHLAVLEILAFRLYLRNHYSYKKN